MAIEVDTNMRIAAISLLGLSAVFLSGCAAWVNDAIHLFEDVKRTSDEYEREKHEERVEELNEEYEEFMRSQGKPGIGDEEPGESIVIKKDHNDTN